MAQLKNNTTYLKLNTGASIPSVGLGTWKSTGEDDGYKSVIKALEVGYRHIDTAAIYKNEDQVGKAINDSGVPRSEIFVTTKLWCTQQHDPKEALEQSLKRLGLDYVDLYLMHWPVPLNPRSIKDGNYLTIPFKEDGTRDVEIDSWNFIKTWELMQELPATGLTKAIGVSNFSINNIKDLLASPGNKITPAANQVELHPLLPQQELIDFCKSKGIVVEAYSPLGSNNAPLLSEKIVIEVAKKNNVTPAEVVISWHVQRGYVVLPKSVNPDRITSNLKTFVLSEEDFKAVSEISKIQGEKRVVLPDWAPFIPFV
ncbi:similar to Saccharomyces cerevisiae YDR368W YPR1 NADPH-dependent aldo-keto reductase [Maudiozyma saulgeensis]|uniref:Similar to Saccharomyces cerevisiae YDR368W YPR1 NADPH-dependent aldo-keto reductase n=1 Tax=Maudiozyma saulgeensis TaxID=1789683 RepID=A0A1X7R1W4_9SACH|nr:similar to Saccharomyces cerevisiae YDR368W YPR1 NADPH-dependent aldo-keto reductase [Kazachstania saulgeensis]